MAGVVDPPTLIAGDWKLIVIAPDDNATRLFDGFTRSCGAQTSGRIPRSARGVALANGTLSSGLYYLFNLIADPTERANLARDRPEVVAALAAELAKLGESAVPGQPTDVDPAADAARVANNNTHVPWLN